MILFFFSILNWFFSAGQTELSIYNITAKQKLKMFQLSLCRLFINAIFTIYYYIVYVYGHCLFFLCALFCWFFFFRFFTLINKYTHNLIIINRFIRTPNQKKKKNQLQHIQLRFKVIWSVLVYAKRVKRNDYALNNILLQINHIFFFFLVCKANLWIKQRYYSLNA